MKIINSDFQKGKVKLKITDPEDLWYLSHLIEPGDLLTGITSRKVKIGESENAKAVKKTFILTIEMESINLEGEQVLRVNGKSQSESEYIPQGSYHALELEMGSEFALEKSHWPAYQKQKLTEASQQKYTYLLCLLDREEALMALTKKSGYLILLRLKGDVPKKVKAVESKEDFPLEIIKALGTYVQRYLPEKIILASPAFYKEDLFKCINNPELKRKIALATCSDVTEAALDEVMRDPELKVILKDSRARIEKLLVEELLQEINKDNLAVYGWKEVIEATEAGAISKLLLTDNFIRKRKLENNFLELDDLMKQIDILKGEIHLLSSENESGKKLDGLGGIAALLRFKTWK